MPVHNAWSAELEKTAREMFESGASPRTVGAAIGKTKNAIVGKSNRDGWDKSRQRRHYNKQPRPLPRKNPFQLDFRRKDIPQGKGSFAPIEQVHLSTPETDLLIPETQRIGMKDDWPTTCCVWPVGDPKKPGFFFCGAIRESDKPYCLAHNMRAKRRAGEIEIGYTT